MLTGLELGKCHIRVIARNAQILSNPAAEWPVYVSMGAPHYPEGLSLEIKDDSIAIRWGKVLCTTGYCLYRRIETDRVIKERGGIVISPAHLTCLKRRTNHE